MGPRLSAAPDRFVGVGAGQVPVVVLLVQVREELHQQFIATVELPRVPSYSTSLLPPCDPAEPRVSYGRRLQAGKCRPEVLPSAGWGLDHGPLELVAQVPSVHQDLMARASVPWHKGLAQVHPPVLSQSILIRLAR